MNDRRDQRPPSVEELLGDILSELRFHGDRLERIEKLVAEQARVSEVPLYCPPSDHCPGGVRLRRHAPEYEKGDGKDIDRFYHPLPEKDWYRFEGQGAFHGSMVKNHSVWRSKALTDGNDADEVEEVDAEPSQPLRFVCTAAICQSPTVELVRGATGKLGHQLPDGGYHVVAEDGELTYIPPRARATR